MKRPKHKPKIITFIGPVGVGKSTQIRLLKKYLESQGQKTFETYLKSAHGLTYVLSLFIRVISNMVYPTDEEWRRLIYRRITPLWNISETISITLKFLFSVYIPHLLGYNVLIEEGVLMSIEHHRTFRPRLLGIKPQRLPLLDTYQRWINSRDHVEIVLEARDEEVAKRRLSRSFRRYESVDYLDIQNQVISRLDGPRLILLDTTNESIEAVHKRIVRNIENLRD
jgi:energy-coupling factor transporter ATP-binding protein EcfA2